MCISFKACTACLPRSKRCKRRLARWRNLWCTCWRRFGKRSTTTCRAVPCPRPARTRTPCNVPTVDRAMWSFILLTMNARGRSWRIARSYDLVTAGTGQCLTVERNSKAFDMRFALLRHIPGPIIQTDICWCYAVPGHLVPRALSFVTTYFVVLPSFVSADPSPFCFFVVNGEVRNLRSKFVPAVAVGIKVTFPCPGSTQSSWLATIYVESPGYGRINSSVLDQFVKVWYRSSNKEANFSEIALFFSFSIFVQCKVLLENSICKQLMS
jgi:hypothetical protein